MPGVCCKGIPQERIPLTLPSRSLKSSDCQGWLTSSSHGIFSSARSSSSSKTAYEEPSPQQLVRILRAWIPLGWRYQLLTFFPRCPHPDIRCFISAMQLVIGCFVMNHRAIQPRTPPKFTASEELIPMIWFSSPPPRIHVVSDLHSWSACQPEVFSQTSGASSRDESSPSNGRRCPSKGDTL